MNKELHIVIGGAGAIGGATIKALQEQHREVITVERSKTVDGVVTRHADLLDLAQTERALQGATHVYLCVGLPYNTEIWQTQWPTVMEHTIAACSKVGAKLIFLDNVYMYGDPLAIPFDETQQQDVHTKKGVARKQTTDMLLKAHTSGRVKAVIGRSADFYGPHAVNSTLYLSFLQRMLEGKQPQTMYRLDVPHTYAYTLDNGRALVRLALDDGSYGQVWHLPVGQPLTIQQAADLFNETLGTDFAVSTTPGPVLAVLSLFMQGIREAQEMAHQFNEPYIMSAEKFLQRYPDFTVTPYEDGFKATVASFAGK